MSKRTLVLPALRGSFGSWVYYACLMPIDELGGRVDYAREVHQSEDMSKMIQRALEGARATQIANYLTTVPERFFNSLVLATYDGDPQWLEVGNFRGKREPGIVELLPEIVSDSIGFLQLSGKEKMFAIDGQHRLAGIKKALKSGGASPDDLVPVIVVGHKATPAGLRRTRRLFTTLNKTAVAVKKMDIIALDEDDVMAIICRRLVESDKRFRAPVISLSSSTALHAKSEGALTVITNLYDVLKRIFMFKDGVRSSDSLRFNRPGEDALEEYFAFASDYFASLAVGFPALGTLFESKSPAKVTRLYRHDDGGHLLFRPLGLDIITRLAVEKAADSRIELTKAVKATSSLPIELSSRPYVGVIWDPNRRVMVPKGREMALELCRHMLGIPTRKSDLLARYRAFTGSPKARLPPRVVR